MSLATTSRLTSLFVLLMIFALAGCQSSSMRAAPAAGTGFVPMSELAPNPDLPFNKAWFKAGVDFSSYHSVYVPGVNTHYMLQGSSWWQSKIHGDQMQQDAQTVAAYMRQHLIDAIKNDPKKRFQVADAAGPGVLVLDVALTELVPSDPVVAALTMAAPYGSGIAVEAAARKAGDVATVAFEARLIDGGTGDTIAMFADRETAKAAYIDFNALTWYSEAHVIIGEWSTQFVAVLERQPGEVVKPAPSFSILAW
ncbi:DUF3313 domain-containing protein [Desulfolutivibrio sp.]|uniref:DUF3313 domain-containing protein n=1 Tax=Desulfolutivibrio sp. TaxID=2773296 RepID=UPI002F962BAD